MAATPIAVEDLRIGMYIQLEGGWLSHPFPLSSFRIAGTDQIETLRGLGLKQIRWWPEKSTLVSDAAADGAEAGAAAAPVAAAPPIEVPAPTPEERAAEQQRAWLAAQRESARLCERQYGEAAQALRGVLDALAARPAEAGSTARRLTQAMLDKMLAAEDVGIRLVSGAGDRNAAHALNVSVISLLIGRTLGLAAEELADLGTGALMHDVGKQDIPERLRHFEDGFSAGETAAYRDHVTRGVMQGRRMALSAGALAVLAQHHEHADGSGFPLQLGGERISMAARIVAIVNRYDRLCNPGSGNTALTPHQAVAMLFAQGRQRYDNAVLNTFIRMMGVYPAGSLVQLTDERYAMVVGVNSSRPLKPRVLVHNAGTNPGSNPADGRQERAMGAELLDLERWPDLGIRRSLSAAKVPPVALQALDPRPRVAYYFEPIAREQHAETLAA